MEKEVNNEQKVSVVRIVDGKIIPASRGDNSDATLALCFADEAALEDFKADLSIKSATERLELLDEYGVNTIHHLAELADDELEQIANEATSEEDFRQKYQLFVDKYAGKLITNYLDDTDLDLYVPNGDNIDSYLGNEDGLFVINGEIIQASLSPVLPYDEIQFSLLSQSQSPTYTTTPTHINSYVISPKKHKKVYFSVSRRYSTVHVSMQVKKKMWYGWKNDPHRDLIFEPHFSGSSIEWIAPAYTRFWAKSKKKLEADLLRITGTGNLTGFIYTWTDFSAEYDNNGNLIVERVGNCNAPRCLASKSETVQVNL